MTAPINPEDTMTDKVTYAWLRWPGGEHRFQIDLTREPFAMALYPVKDPYARLQRLVTGQWSPEDVLDTVMTALIGGMGIRRMSEAQRLFSETVKGRPIGEFLPLAQTVMGIAIFGIDKALADRVSDPADINIKSGDDDDGE